MKYLENMQNLQDDGVSKAAVRSPNILYLEASISHIHHEDALHLYDCSYYVILIFN